MVDQVDAAVDTLVRHLGIIADVGVPRRGVVAGEVVAHAGLLVETGGAGSAVRPDDLHPHDISAAPLPQFHHGAAGCKECRVAGALRQEVDPGIRQTLVDLKAQRDLAVGCGQMSLTRGVRRGCRVPPGSEDRQSRSSRDSSENNFRVGLSFRVMGMSPSREIGGRDRGLANRSLRVAR